MKQKKKKKKQRRRQQQQQQHQHLESAEEVHVERQHKRVLFNREGGGGGRGENYQLHRRVSIIMQLGQGDGRDYRAAGFEREVGDGIAGGAVEHPHLAAAAQVLRISTRFKGECGVF